ncbi:MAG: hypothetical protein A3D31_18435 [Candidatus Fluviicola riflensis]|nr:MAG: hypothetical protein CHH17_03725 [Candidatus Fluviicola riflensis]OGS76427.1 MAG: hypothetical protein A3D31_18435 [Candidatus Fluviicola riflensis]OGS82721.1 MAG: hypothetical protein A2724_13260 [Fluviicola sp. RIFCSPHIGHO2_01_FULL_43_53]OGS89020.1 MAG: hypothetical protein A3E30_16920 [Fluviicola sp. RIFCSPHIGHO2_12_FULL_43_24]
MKNQILTFLLLFVATAAIAQADSDDKTRLRGSWGIVEMAKDEDLAMSLDPQKQQKIIDDAWVQDSVMMLEMGMNKAMLTKNMEEQSELLSKVTFVFDKKGKVTVSPNDGVSADVFSPYTLNEAKKELTIEEENGDKLVYNYLITDNELILKRESDMLIFKRKSTINKH